MEVYDVTFDYIERHWTERQYTMFVMRLNEDRTRETAMPPPSNGTARGGGMTLTAWAAKQGYISHGN